MPPETLSTEIFMEPLPGFPDTVLLQNVFDTTTVGTVLPFKSGSVVTRFTSNDPEALHP